MADDTDGHIARFSLYGRLPVVDALDYLVTSRARRALLDVLLADQLEGSVSEVARRAHIQPSTAERELRRMEACGLVSFQRLGKENVVRRRGAAFAKALRALRRPTHRPEGDREAESARVREALAYYGAPLFVAKGKDDVVPRLEVALAAALRLAHEDPAVAGNLPVVFWKNRDVDTDELTRLALRQGEGQTLGFLLELTDDLAGANFFRPAAASLEDKRLRKSKNFFSRDGRFGAYEEELALMNTPEVAKRWHFSMNMSLDSFKSYFRKGTQPSVRLGPS
jgi:DNA-binding transcriptional ArsR family regulator